MLWPADKYDIAFSKIVEDALGEGITVLMLVASDPDAVATHMILKALLKSEGVLFTIKAVGGFDDLLEAHEMNIKENDDLRSVVLVGCGAMLNLSEAFPLPDEVTCYVLDSHRPVDISNVHSDAQYVVFSDVLLDQEEFPSDDEEMEEMNASENEGDDDDDDDDDDEIHEDEEDEDEDEFEMDEEELGQNNTNTTTSSSNAPSPGSTENVRSVNNNTNEPNGSSPGSKRKRGDNDEFQDDDEEDEDEDEVGSSGKKSSGKNGKNGKKGGDEKAKTKYAIRERKRERQRTLREYYSGTKTGTPSSYVAYDLANQLGRGNNDLLWYAIVGVTDHYEQGRLDQDIYSGLHMSLRDWVNNLNAEGNASQTTFSVDDKDTRVRVPDEGRIQVMEEEYRIMTYRHWNVYEAMYHGQYVSTQLLTWTEKGKSKLDTFLAKMGISKKECSQPYNFMSTSGKSKLRTKISQFKNEHDLDNLLYRSFTRVNNYTKVTSAADTAHAVLAMLECGKMNNSTRVHVPDAKTNSGRNDGEQEDALEEAEKQADIEMNERLGVNFHDAQQVFQLSNHNSDQMFKRGVQLAQEVQKAILRQGVALIQQKLLRNAGKFRYAYLSTMSDGDLNFFKRPPLLSKLAHWLIAALPNTKKRVTSNNLPIVLCVLDEARQVYICVGTPGPTELKNRFGQAFRKAADLIEVRYKHNSFTSSVIEIEKEHVMNFTDQLYLTLEQMDRRRIVSQPKRPRTSFQDVEEDESLVEGT